MGIYEKVWKSMDIEITKKIIIIIIIIIISSLYFLS